MNITALVDACIAYVMSEPTLNQFVLSTFVVFVIVYRFNVQRRIRYAINFPRVEDSSTDWHRFKSKLLNCESCFGFWLCLLISTNLTTAAAAFLLYNYYEQDRSN